MSDQPPPYALTETELSARLHGLAAHSAAPATGAQARSRAQRRRRDRRVLICTTALAAAALTAATSGALGSTTKATAPPATSPTPVQRVTVDLDGHTLVVEGRKFRVAAPLASCPIGETSVTVTAKYPAVRLSHGNRYGTSRKWVVTFTDRSHHERLLTIELDPVPDVGVTGTRIFGAIALAPADAKWVYDTIRPGARVEIKGRQAANASADATCVDRGPFTVTP
ncbi:hypothetical protein [Streptomyces sp. NPDC086787]|uniref:hypothetical protein n=1 Tax=Streptomyces sp. NPDC086787 TaxID=3365759 RepID=UPI0038049332